MPIIVYFQGTLTTSPERDLTAQDGLTAEALDLAARPRPVTYTIRATDQRARDLAQLRAGDQVVVIGHVVTDSWTDEDQVRHHREIVVLDSLGIPVGTQP